MGRRIRSIKPEIIEDEKTANLDHLEWRLFVSLWVIADDYGNLRGDPNYVRGAVLWAKSETTEAVGEALAELDRVDLIRFYSVRGQLYIHIPGWGKHQKVDKPGKPQMPGPSEQDSPVGIRETLARVSRDTAEGSIPQHLSVVAQNSRESRESLATDRDQDQDQREGEEGEGTVERLSLPSEDLTGDLERSRSALNDRQRLRKQKWAELEILRREVARELRQDVRPLPAQDQGERDLGMRIREADDLERAEADIDHVLAVYAAEARGKRTVQYLTGKMFREDMWRTALGKTVADAEHEAMRRVAQDRTARAKADEEPVRRIKTL